jgi:glycosyltransferase involved in cell wall biosynthesis
MLNLLRKWDVSVSKRPHFYIANSKEVKRRIKKYYKRESTVIYPPVDVEKLIPSGKIIKEDYYIAVSRLVPYKKTDLIVKTFKILKNRKIKIVGTGPEFNRLLKMAGNAKNIEFLGWVDDTKKINIIQKARALIFAAHEDFGIVPVEAQAAGTPVIAYAKGGVLETVIDGKTGILFERQAVNSLINAIKRFESANFKTHILIENAKKFSKERFKREFTNFVAKKIKETGRI